MVASVRNAAQYARGRTEFGDGIFGGWAYIPIRLLNKSVNVPDGELQELHVQAHFQIHHPHAIA